MAVPYVKARAFDSLFIARDVWLFLLVGVTVVFLVTHFRRRAYEEILAYRNSHTKQTAAVRRALAEFFVGRLEKCPIEGCKAHPYRKDFVLLPESGLFIGLLLALAWESMSIIVLCDPAVAHDFDSLFLGYFPALCFAGWVGAIFAVGARRYFDHSVTAVVGGRVSGARFHWLLHTVVRPIHRLFPRMTPRAMRAWVVLSIAGLGLISIALPWVHPWDMRGYALFATPVPATLRQVAQIQILPPPSDKIILPIDWDRLVELRILVAYGIGFLLFLMIATSADLTGRPRNNRFLKLGARYLSWGVLLFAAEIVTCLSVLQLNSEAFIAPFGITDFQTGGAPDGLPLKYSDPEYGAWIFIGCCCVLAIFSTLRGKVLREVQFHRYRARRREQGLATL